MRVAGILPLAVLLGAVTTTAHSDEVANFFRGKTITIISPIGEGGTYDFYGRLGGEMMKKFLPGNPGYVMQFMVGAGGTKANNYIANIAAKDGTVLISVHSNTAQTQLMEAGVVRYDAAKFTMIGQFAAMNSALTVWHQSPAKTIQEAMKTEVVIGATGKGSYQYQFPALLNALAGTKFKIVAGYKSVREENIAMERGEIHGRGGTLASWDITEADWVRDKKIIHLVQVGTKRSPNFPDVPLATELVKDEESKQMILLVSSGALLGRGLGGPPSIPEDRVKALRAAFEKGLKDPEILEFARQRKLYLEPTTGEEFAAVIKGVLATPPGVIEKTKRLLGIKDRDG